MNPLRIIKRFLDKILGAKADELFWKFHHFFDKDWAQSYISDGSLNHLHRKLLVEKISEYSPLKNVLEVGSASGPNLYLLANKFPKTNFYGIDISASAIYQGKHFLEKHGKKNVFLRMASIFQLEDFKDKSMDIVFSDAVLLYVGPNKVVSVLKEMIRVAKKAIILCEQHTSDESFYDDKWIHNYHQVIEKNIPNAKINFTKIIGEIWQGDWVKYGYIIEVIL